MKLDHLKNNPRNLKYLTAILLLAGSLALDGAMRNASLIVGYVLLARLVWVDAKRGKSVVTETKQ
jgi:hypothetical protein